MKQKVIVIVMVMLVGVFWGIQSAQSSTVRLSRKQKLELDYWGVVNVGALKRVSLNWDEEDNPDRKVRDVAIFACITNNPKLAATAAQYEGSAPFLFSTVGGKDRKGIFSLAVRWGGYKLFESLYQDHQVQQTLFKTTPCLKEAIDGFNNEAVKWCVGRGCSFTTTEGKALDALRESTDSVGGKSALRRAEYSWIENFLSQLPNYQLVMKLVREPNTHVHSRQAILSDAEEPESSDDEFESDPE